MNRRIVLLAGIAGGGLAGYSLAHHYRVSRETKTIVVAGCGLLGGALAYHL